MPVIMVSKEHESSVDTDTWKTISVNTMYNGSNEGLYWVNRDKIARKQNSFLGDSIGPQETTHKFSRNFYAYKYVFFAFF